MSRDTIAKSAFARWLLTHCRLAGYDADADETRASILLLAAVALSQGLGTKATAGVADMLGVTPDEVTDAYLSEMQQTVLAGLLDHPDLAELDSHLEEIARTD